MCGTIHCECGNWFFCPAGTPCQDRTFRKSLYKVLDTEILDADRDDSRKAVVQRKHLIPQESMFAVDIISFY